MITINFNSDTETKTFNFCENYSEIKVAQFLNLMAFHMDKRLSITDKAIKLIASISDSQIEVEELMLDMLPEETVQFISNFEWLKDGDITKFKKLIIDDYITVGTIKYEVIKNLNKLKTRDTVQFESIFLNDRNLTPIECAIFTLFREVDENNKRKENNIEQIKKTIKNFNENCNIVDIYGNIELFMVGEATSKTNIKPSWVIVNKAK